MSVHAIIAKIGGKILEDPENLTSTITQLRELLKLNIVEKIIIISGGGSKVNFLRKIDSVLCISDDLAHWMAILAMDYNGIELSKKFSDINYVNNFNLLQEYIIENKHKQIIVFGPYNYLSNEDVLPHSWDVTSDSITLFLANKLKLNVCYLIKDIDGIFLKDKTFPITEISTKKYSKLINTKELAKIEDNTIESKESQPIDLYMLELINNYKIPCIILNGTEGKLSILRYFDVEENYGKIYTKIFHD